MQNHPDDNNCNFAWVSRISRNYSSRPVSCIELLKYNDIYGIPFFSHEKTDAKIVNCDDSACNYARAHEPLCG